jgi:hypothetical protein
VLTDRGLAAAHALREFEQVLEAGLAQALSLAELAALWDGLAALAEVSRRSAARVIERLSGSGPGRVVERRVSAALAAKRLRTPRYSLSRARSR